MSMLSAETGTSDRLHKAKGLQIGDLHPDALPIVIHDSVLDQIIDFSEQDKSRELGGFLIGRERQVGIARIAEVPRLHTARFRCWWDFWRVPRCRESVPRVIWTEHLEIRRFLPATGVRREFASVTFTHETWSNLTREVETSFPGEKVLGWQHTHPGFGIFLSSYDSFIHKHFFSAPWQVALVVDPRRQEFGFFQWRSGEIVNCGFICVQA